MPQACGPGRETNYGGSMFGNQEPTDEIGRFWCDALI